MKFAYYARFFEFFEFFFRRKEIFEYIHCFLMFIQSRKGSEHPVFTRFQVQVNETVFLDSEGFFCFFFHIIDFERQLLKLFLNSFAYFFGIRRMYPFFFVPGMYPLRYWGFAVCSSPRDTFTVCIISV